MLDLSKNQPNFATFDLVKYRVNEKVLSCWVVIIIQLHLPLNTFCPRRRFFFRPGLLWSSSGQNEQNEISLTCMYY